MKRFVYVVSFRSNALSVKSNYLKLKSKYHESDEEQRTINGFCR